MTVFNHEDDDNDSDKHVFERQHLLMTTTMVIVTTAMTMKRLFTMRMMKSETMSTVHRNICVFEGQQLQQQQYFKDDNI